MAQVSKFGLLRHLRAEPNEFILHFRSGQVVRSGAGMSYFFNPLTASIALVPVEDCETTFMLGERASDFQDVSVQCTLTYRVVDHGKAASRVNFSVSLVNGSWLERPLERLASLWSQKALEPVRRFVAAAPVVDVVQRGAEQIRSDLDKALRSDPEIQAIGLELVTVQVSRVAPTSELEKALQTPTREGLQQKADEAVFARRALAVEKERAIKQNELATELELSRRQAELIEQRGANQLREVERQAVADRAKVEAEITRQGLVTVAEVDRQRALTDGEAARRLALAEADGEVARIAAEAHARDVVSKAIADANARREADHAEHEREAQRAALWQETPQRVAHAFAMQAAAERIAHIQNLHVTPDLLRAILQEFADAPKGS